MKLDKIIEHGSPSIFDRSEFRQYLIINRSVWIHKLKACCVPEPNTVWKLESSTWWSASPPQDCRTSPNELKLRPDRSRTLAKPQISWVWKRSTDTKLQRGAIYEKVRLNLSNELKLKSSRFIVDCCPEQPKNAKKTWVFKTSVIIREAIQQ